MASVDATITAESRHFALEIHFDDAMENYKPSESDPNNDPFASLVRGKLLHTGEKLAKVTLN